MQAGAGGAVEVGCTGVQAVSAHGRQHESSVSAQQPAGARILCDSNIKLLPSGRAQGGRV